MHQKAWISVLLSISLALGVTAWQPWEAGAKTERGNT